MGPGEVRAARIASLHQIGHIPKSHSGRMRYLKMHLVVVSITTEVNCTVCDVSSDVVGANLASSSLRAEPQARTFPLHADVPRESRVFARTSQDFMFAVSYLITQLHSS